MRGCASFRCHEPGRSSSAGGERRTVWLRRGRSGFGGRCRAARGIHAWRGSTGFFTSRVIAGAVCTRIQSWIHAVRDALRSDAMNLGGLLRPGVNVGRADCAVATRLRVALPRCARYPRMAWIYGVFPSRVIGGAVLTRINRRSTPCVDALRSGAMNPGGLLRPGVNVGQPGCAAAARASAGVAALRAVSTHGVDLRGFSVAGHWRAVSTHGVDLRVFTLRSFA